MLARMGNLTLTHERIDDIPLLVKLGQVLQLDTAVDTCLGTHGLQQGLSNGQLTIVWLAYKSVGRRPPEVERRRLGLAASPGVGTPVGTPPAARGLQ